MNNLPGNPYHFEGCEQYFMNIDSKRKAYYDGLKKGKEIYTKKRESVGECPICLDKIDQGFVTTDCGHTLCMRCFNNTLHKLNNKCPLCRSIMVTGVVSSGEMDIACRESYHNGFEDGYTSGVEYMDDILDTIKQKHKDRMEKLTEKYTYLTRVYNGTIRQLHNTHTLNLSMKKRTGIVRTNSFDTYLKD